MVDNSTSLSSSSVTNCRRTMIITTDITKPFSTYSKLADWVPFEQQINTFTTALDIWDLVPEEEGVETYKTFVNLLNVYSYLRPENTDPQQVADDAEE